MITLQRSTKGADSIKWLNDCSVIYNFDSFITHPDLKERLQLEIDNFNDEIDYDGMWDMDECEKRLNNNYLLLIKFDDLYPGNIIGWLWLDLNTGYIYNIYVNKDHRRKNVGYTICEYALKIAHGHGIKNTYVQIDEWNTPSLELHKKLGYELQ